MRRILSDLNPNDLFNIIMFHSEHTRWKTESVKATPENVREAIAYVNDSVAEQSKLSDVDLCNQT